MKVHHFLFSAICILLMASSCQKEPQVIKVESVALNTTSLTIVEGESQSLTATVSPSNADNKKVTWSSSNSSVATVDDRGTVTAVAAGTATITAKSDDGGKTATCAVTVNSKVISVESFSLDKTSAEITEGETLTLTATIKPENATNKNVIWSSSNEEIATVKDGVVTAIKAGEVTITAKTEDGGKTATCAVKVKAKIIAVESVSLDKTEVTLEIGETVTLIATISPDNATDKTVTWTSSDESIATVKEGVVSAIKAGSATITAKAGEKTATCAVAVKAEVTTNPFTITSVGSTSVSIKKVGDPYGITLEYRKGAENWSPYTIDSPISLTDGEIVQFVAGEDGNANFSKGDYNFYEFGVSGSGSVKASGNIMSLLDRTGKRTTMPEYGFYQFFLLCKGLDDASKLELPATTLAEGCYGSMFYYCSNLQTAPALPATTLAERCYAGMFKNCTSLQTAPALPATTLAEGCYGSMFYYCSNLQTAPELPATTLAEYCYSGMFSDCTSLQVVPEILPATTLAKGCYNGMFERCKNLQTAPELPATTLAERCYNGMFISCSSLQTAPALPATTLADYCYTSMFQNCTSLQTAPALPATTLAKGCYGNMFFNCTSLQTAPVLPAATLAELCYDSMFSYCRRLNYVKALFTTTPSTAYTMDWLENVSSTGTFVKSKNATWDVRGTNGIPSGWTVQIAE